MAKNINEIIEKKIKEQTREDIGGVNLKNIKIVRNRPPDDRSGESPDNHNVHYSRIYYLLDRGSNFKISRASFNSYRGAKTRSELRAADGKLNDTGLQAHFNAHYSILFYPDIERDFSLNFDIESTVNLYLSYTPINGSEVPVYYDTDDNGNYIGAGYTSGVITLHDLSARKWYKLDIFIYSDSENAYFKDTIGDIGTGSIAWQLPDSSPPSPPSWNDSYTTTTLLADITTSSTSISVSDLENEPSQFGVISINNDIIQYKNGSTVSFAAASGISVSHSSGDTVGYGFIEPVISTYDGIQDTATLTIRWTNPTLDSLGFALNDFGGIGIYEVEWATGATITSTSGWSATINSNDNSYPINESVLIDNVIYTVSGYSYGINETDIVLSRDDGGSADFSVGDTIYVPTYKLLSEISDLSTSATIYPDGVMLGTTKYLALDAFDRGFFKNRSAKTHIRKIEIGSASALPDPKTYVNVTETQNSINAVISPNYFQYSNLLGKTIKKIEWYVEQNTSNNTHSISNATLQKTGTDKGVIITGAIDTSVFYHIYVKMYNGNNVATTSYIGAYQIGSAGYVPDGLTEFGSDNIITSFDTMSSYPYANEILSRVSEAFNNAYGTYISPCVVVDIRTTTPSQLLDTFEILASEALYWGTCTVSGYVITGTSITSASNESTFTTSYSGLTSQYFIDANGKEFLIESNTSSTLTLINNGQTPVAGEFGILANRDVNY